ncbi:DEAD/DEAH box helicase [Phormidium tenue FACHB-886]|nr:DEAD/DEAH box helicase [Phormidium tenue FACHB-886]
MKILHGSWIPHPDDGFIQTGAFYLWVEVLPQKRKGRAATKESLLHPGQLSRADLEAFLSDRLSLKPTPRFGFSRHLSQQYFALPTAEGRPLPSPELARYLEIEIPDAYEGLRDWEVTCYGVASPTGQPGSLYEQSLPVIKFLNDLHFLALHSAEEFQLGADLLFWYHYTQSFKQVIYKEQYIPAFKYRELSEPTKKTKKGKTSTSAGTPKFELYATWEIISQSYEANLKDYVEYMPLLCAAGSSIARKAAALYDSETLLRHFSECLLTNLLIHTPSTAKFDKQIADTFIYSALHPQRCNPQATAEALEHYQQWLRWKTQITRTQIDSPFDLCFQLHSAPPNHPDRWQLEFLVAAKQDPSLRRSLSDYWQLTAKQKTSFTKQFGKDFETHLLLNLGYAARIYSKLWEGLDNDRPTGLQLTLEDAFTFLKESAWILEDAGFRVIVPAWYTPAGRRRAKIRLKAAGKKIGASKTNQSYFSFDTLVQYQYELAIGEAAVSAREWEQLVNAKAPLVQFRGQWMELDKDKMQQMLEFWQKQADELPEMTLLEMMQRSAEDEFEIEPDGALAELMARLRDKSRLEPIADLPNLQGTLREYQKRGVSWIHYLEQLGLNGCLADDMGLGKSITVIARLVQERNESAVSPTLLIAPTSVVGNWQHEIAKFAPQLKAIVHHGGDRLQSQADFEAVCSQYDVVITSYTLARKDEKLFNSISWHRVVIDEAQNIKNPKAAQTRAILKLSAQHRLALTGTPVENRLLDLWSIFNFLNPGYLGKESQFRKGFEIPIQKTNDARRATTLKKLVEPLILRRVKTDPTIIQDLPDKIEQKLFTYLTKEQASLYEAVVKEITGELQSAEGIQRKGLILSTLMRLKQICNHPAQFLQDGSEFSSERSQKLSRLAEMVEEAIAEGESILIFSQFKEVCDELERYLRKTLHCNTYYIHGGTLRAKRERMIREFQDPETEPSVFILSLKAGGVGITLTKANHVFHFDRWWNPAVEDQASDRAFRIGQTKRVFVHKFVSIGTLEERIDQMIEDKKKLAGAIVGADESWLTELDNEAFQRLIELNRSAILEVG